MATIRTVTRLFRDKATASKTGGRRRGLLGSGQTSMVGGPKRGSTPKGLHFNQIRKRR